VLGVVCTLCRGPLDWDGGCNRCHGCTSGRREDWTFPGNKYELDKGHWHRVCGPRKALTPAEVKQLMADVRRQLAGTPLGER